MIHDILDLHTHTIMSGHAYNTMQEMIRSASEKGVRLLGITEHAPRIPGACHPFYFINFRVVPREQFGVKLMLGCELNIIDYKGNVDLEPRYLAGLDYAVASIHEPCYDSGTTAQITPNIVLETENIQTVLALAEKGMGITFYPRMFISGQAEIEELKNGQGPLNFYSLDHPKAHGVLAIGYHKGHYMSQATKEFIQTAKKMI